LTCILGKWTSRSKSGSLGRQNFEIASFAVVASRVRGTTRVLPGAPLKSIDVQRGVRWTSECDVGRTEEFFHVQRSPSWFIFFEISHTDWSQNVFGKFTGISGISMLRYACTLQRRHRRPQADAHRHSGPAKNTGAFIFAARSVRLIPTPPRSSGHRRSASQFVAAGTRIQAVGRDRETDPVPSASGHSCG
jgi:hypothetical protein